ncbi:hypothetical protein D3C71_1675010 [compost metagenome]
MVQGHLQRAAGPRPGPGAHRHHGARVFADLPGPGRAAARLPKGRTRRLGAGIPGRPGHCADRHRGHGRLSGRLRPVLRQAFRRSSARLGRPGGLGREGPRALHPPAHRRAHQAAGVFRRARPGTRPHAVPPLWRPHTARLWHWNESHQRHGRRTGDATAQHRDEAGARQRTTCGETLRHARQDAVRR